MNRIDEIRNLYQTPAGRISITIDDVGLLLDYIDKLLAALEEIAKGEGRFSLDPLTHASNTIEDMQAIARAAVEY